MPSTLAAAYTNTAHQILRRSSAYRAFIALPCSSSSYSSSCNNNYVWSTSENRNRSRTRRYISNTPLDTPEGSDLIKGLTINTVSADGDGHPLAVYSIADNDFNNSTANNNDNKKRCPILLLHGRTWSAVPVYHLKSRSLMEAFRECNLEPYAVDFRGFGGTPRDATNRVEPHRCVNDTETVLKWIADRHELESHEMPALLGWSQGALVAQLTAQKSPQLMSKLTLYGSIYDPLVRYPRAPLYTKNGGYNYEHVVVENTYDGAIEDFTIEGSIAPDQAKLFAQAALISDPLKAIWARLDEFNNCDPARVNVPTLVVAGDQDPYAPLRVQSELFSNLGRGADRTWSIIADADHAVHLLEGRGRFIRAVESFVQNGGKGGSSPF